MALFARLRHCSPTEIPRGAWPPRLHCFLLFLPGISMMILRWAGGEPRASSQAASRRGAPMLLREGMALFARLRHGRQLPTPSGCWAGDAALLATFSTAAPRRFCSMLGGYAHALFESQLASCVPSGALLRSSRSNVLKRRHGSFRWPPLAPRVFFRWLASLLECFDVIHGHFGQNSTLWPCSFIHHPSSIIHHPI